MSEWTELVSSGPAAFTLRLVHPETLNPDRFRAMEKDESALSCLLLDAQAGTLLYTMADNVPLADFLDQVLFGKKEAYTFIRALLERALAVNRDKPVWLDFQGVFVSPHGDQFRFTVIPEGEGFRMFQPEEVRAFLEQVCRHFRTETAYEVIGLLQSEASSSSPGLPQVLDKLELLRRTYLKESRFRFRRREAAFFLNEEIHPFARENQERFDYGSLPSGPALVLADAPDLQEPLPASEPSKVSEPEPVAIQDETPTMLIDDIRQTGAWLEQGNTRYDLLFETMQAGRSMQCDIRLDDPQISSQHARFLREDDRWYIQDLKSANGTFLGEKKVVRRMRLKDGMVIRLARTELLFRQP